MCQFERNVPRSWSIISSSYKLSWWNSLAFPSQPLQVVYQLSNVVCRILGSATVTCTAREGHKMAQSCCKKSGLWWQLLHFSCQNVVSGRHICFRCFALFLSSQSSALSSKPGMLKKATDATERAISDCAYAVVSKHSIASSDRGHTKRKLCMPYWHLCHYASCLNGVDLLPTLLRDHPSIVEFRIKSSILPSKRHFFSLYSCKLGIANLYHQNHLLLLLDKHQRINTYE